MVVLYILKVSCVKIVTSYKRQPYACQLCVNPAACTMYTCVCVCVCCICTLMYVYTLQVVLLGESNITASRVEEPMPPTPILLKCCIVGYHSIRECI